MTIDILRYVDRIAAHFPIACQALLPSKRLHIEMRDTVFVFSRGFAPFVAGRNAITRPGNNKRQIASFSYCSLQLNGCLLWKTVRLPALTLRLPTSTSRNPLAISIARKDLSEASRLVDLHHDLKATYNSRYVLLSLGRTIKP